jgi:hypothetical protein
MPIANHSYDADAKTYTVQFKEGGPVYQYNDVPADVAGTVQSASQDDLGKTVQAALVQGGFEFSRLPPPEVEDGADS